MPELPDLQVFARNLNKKIAGKKVAKINVINAPKLNVNKEELQKALEGKVLKEIKRAGKELHFVFDDGNVLGLHLMLNGELLLFEGKSDDKYKIIELLFDDSTGLAMKDFRAYANPTLNPEESDAPDALEADEKYLKEKLKKTKGNIKKFLLDQHKIRGIGNAYADEILWEAKISPFSACNKIPEDKVEELHHSIKNVLKNAEKHILQTHPDLITGEVRDFLNVHNARKKTSPTGAPIKNEIINSRKTYFTDEQVLYE